MPDLMPLQHGTLQTYTDSGDLYCLRTFGSNGTFRWSGPNATNIGALIVEAGEIW